MAKKNEIVTVEILNEEQLGGLIHVIRGQQVMLDSDLAAIYGYSTSAFNQQVKNNIEKFNEEDFMFQLTDNETKGILMSKKLISSWGGKRKNPYDKMKNRIFNFSSCEEGRKCLPLLFKRKSSLARSAAMLLMLLTMSAGQVWV